MSTRPASGGSTSASGVTSSDTAIYGIGCWHSRTPRTSTRAPQPRARATSAGGFPVVVGDQLLELIVPQVRLGPSVAEIDVGIVPAGVLEIDQPQALWRVDQVLRHEVVMAGDHGDGMGGERLADPLDVSPVAAIVLGQLASRSRSSPSPSSTTGRSRSTSSTTANSYRVWCVRAARRTRRSDHGSRRLGRERPAVWRRRGPSTRLSGLASGARTL
jgi:hypothetical protein